MTTKTRTQNLELLEAEYQRRKAAIRADANLSWEQKELQVKRLGNDYHRARIEAERETT